MGSMENGNTWHNLSFHLRAEKPGKWDMQESQTPCLSLIVDHLF
jgi:hypothetical protein